MKKDPLLAFSLLLGTAFCSITASHAAPLDLAAQAESWLTKNLGLKKPQAQRKSPTRATTKQRTRQARPEGPTVPSPLPPPLPPPRPREDPALALEPPGGTSAPEPPSAKDMPTHVLSAIPLPPPRPSDLASRPPDSAPAAPSPAPSPGLTDTQPVAPAEQVPDQPPVDADVVQACDGALAHMVVTPATGVPQEGACAVERPVRLEAVLIGHNRRIALQPPAVLSCSTAAAIAAWIRDDITPLADATGSPLVSIAVADSYSCRPRNRVVGAKPSAHGNGIAFDLGPMVLADKRTLTMQGEGLTLAARQLLKASACARFGTVLGQGSDGYHEDHLHVDLIPRKPGRAICQWTLPAESKG